MCTLGQGMCSVRPSTLVQRMLTLVEPLFQTKLALEIAEIRDLVLAFVLEDEIEPALLLVDRDLNDYFKPLLYQSINLANSKFKFCKFVGSLGRQETAPLESLKLAVARTRVFSTLR